MYTALSAEEEKEILELGKVELIVKNGWETSTAWVSVPFHLVISIGNSLNRIMNCYLSVQEGSVVVSRLRFDHNVKSSKATDYTLTKKMIRGLINYTRDIDKKFLIIESSDIPCFAEVLSEMKFRIKKSTNSTPDMILYRGFLEVK